MPFQDLTLLPTVDTQKTLLLNQAGISVSQLIRFKENLIQKIGGWTAFYRFPVSSTPVREIHGFSGLLGQKVLAAGSLTNLVVITSGVLTDITPQFRQSNPTPSFSVSSGSSIVTVTDPGSSVSVYDAVRLDTPVAVGGILLNGAYPILSAIDGNTYTIASTGIATTTVSSGGTLPSFYTTAGSAVVDVLLPNNNFTQVLGLYYPFRAATSVGGLTIQGAYQISAIIDSTHFQITATTQSTTTLGSSQAVTMNSSHASFYYYVALGPAPTAGGWGTGAWGGNAWGTGQPPGQGAGAPITVTDWTLDNWGGIILGCPSGGPIYTWSVDGAPLQQAQPVVQGGAPLFNGGAFVTQPQQILMCWGSCQSTQVQDPLIIRWSDAANYQQWAVNSQTFAGSFRVPTGSKLVAGLQGPLYPIFWTDIDVWIANYIGQPIVFSFMRVGTGCGALGQHAAEVLGPNVFWASNSNFYMLSGNGVSVVPCSVWDFFFQQLDPANSSKVRCATNAVMNEITWYFPVIGGTGENTAYVKLHYENNEFNWDYGMLARTAWIDVTALGFPIGSDASGNLVQHELTNDASGTPINAYFESGWFSLGDATQFVFVDWCLPDMRWTTFGSAGSGTVMFTFYVVDYPGDTQRVYGPYNVTQANEYINLRMRGRYFRMRVESNDLGSFWRLGKVKFRWQPSGRR